MKNILFLLLILSSCTGKKDNINKERIIMLKKEISMQKSLNDSLLHHKNLTIDIIDSLRNNKNYPYLDKEVVSSFLQPEMRFTTNDESLIKAFFDNLNLDYMCFWYSLFNSQIFNEFVIDNNIDNEESYLNYLWIRYDRDEESIKSLFTKKRMDFIYSLFKYNNYYINSGLKNSIEGLLLAYKEIGGNEDILNELYTKSLSSEGGLVIENIISDEIKILLQEKKYCKYNSITMSNSHNRAFRVYSFWARRHHENNKEIVFELLKDFYKNVHVNKKSSDNLSGYDEDYEEEDYDTGYRTLDDLAIKNFIELNQSEMDSIVNSTLKVNAGEFNLNELKKIYQTKFPQSKPMKIYAILDEVKGGYRGDEKDVNYVNSGGWQNNSKFTVEIPIHDVYYVYVSKNNVIYKQLIYKKEETEIVEPKEEAPYDDDNVKIIDKKQVVIARRDENDNKTYSEIFHPDMPEGKYLYFVKVVTKDGNVFFSEIQILNCIRGK